MNWKEDEDCVEKVRQTSTAVRRHPELGNTMPDTLAERPRPADFGAL